MKNQTVFSLTSPHHYTGTTVKSISTDFSSSCSLKMTNFLTEESHSIDTDYTFSNLFTQGNNLFTGQSNGDFSIFSTNNLEKVFSNKVSDSPIYFSYNFSKNLIAMNKQSEILLFDVNKETFFPSINLNNPVTCLKFNSKISHVLAIGTTNSLVLTDLRQKKILLQIHTDKINQIDFNSEHNTTLLYNSNNILYSFDLINDLKKELFASTYFSINNNLLYNVNEGISLYDMNYALIKHKNLSNIYQISFSEYYDDLFSISYGDGNIEVNSKASFFNDKCTFVEPLPNCITFRDIHEPILDDEVNKKELKSIFSGSLQENDQEVINEDNKSLQKDELIPNKDRNEITGKSTNELIVYTYIFYKSKVYKHKSVYNLISSIYSKILNNTSINDLLIIKDKESFFDRKDKLLLHLIYGRINELAEEADDLQVSFKEVINSYFSNSNSFTNPLMLLLSLMHKNDLSSVLNTVNKNDWDILLLFIYNNIEDNNKLINELGNCLEDKEGSLICYLLSNDLSKYLSLRNNLPGPKNIFNYFNYINEYMNFYYENKNIITDTETKTYKEFREFINKGMYSDTLNLIDNIKQQPSLINTTVGLSGLNLKTNNYNQSISFNNNTTHEPTYNTTHQKTMTYGNKSELHNSPITDITGIPKPPMFNTKQPMTYPNNPDISTQHSFNKPTIPRPQINNPPSVNMPSIPRPQMTHNVEDRSSQQQMTSIPNHTSIPRPQMTSAVDNNTPHSFNTSPMGHTSVPRPQVGNISYEDKSSLINQSTSLPYTNKQSDAPIKNTYGSLRGKQAPVLYENKLNSFNKMNDKVIQPNFTPNTSIPSTYSTQSSFNNQIHSTVPPVIPQVNQPNVSQSLNNTTLQPIIDVNDVKEFINATITFLKNESLSKKGLVYKSKTNSALKKLENYNVNSFDYTLLSKLISFFNKINIEEIKVNKSTIKSQLLADLNFESDRISKELSGSGIGVFLNAVFTLLQVVLS
ncbi:hypothetical protein H312_02956 [Anncaliia algerae PRA339]|uniref:Protein transport protein SEC31 n=1 Tax=Anncaliia algerae PRA339 TaxID=1288291 RepID=A0A059EXL3_9MICR|nr:hypothetical protein H312_02956 [Anncaliia algerae PRA339]